MLSIVVPTYNESHNVVILADRVAKALENADYELIFVDDSSDQTPLVLENLCRQDARVRFWHRDGERGLASAVVRGFKLAKGDILAVMDADLQHPPELLPVMLAEVEKCRDIVVPSRLIPGGSDGGLTTRRKLVSWSARMLGKLLLHRLRDVSDPTGGFFMLRRSVIAGVPLNPVGWKILMEVLIKGRYHSLSEIPFRFAPRTHEQSKLSLGEQFNYLRHLVRLVRSSPTDLKFWRLVIAEITALFTGTLVFLLGSALASGPWAALLASCSYIPANRVLHPRRRVKGYTFAPGSGTIPHLVGTTIGGTGWILSVYFLCIQWLPASGLTALILGCATRTVWVLAGNLRAKTRAIARGKLS